jgi:glyoxylase-like metal-dependent hydrolase (beta-lactamase superfamily II)
MQNLIPGVHVSSPALLSFDQSIELRAFLLRRESGNLLIYSTASLATEAPTVEELGGVAGHYLGHGHEAGYGHAEAAAPFGAPLFCHENERATVSETCPVAATFADRHRLDDEFEVIPIPGHTSGSTAFLWDTGQHRCLFSADTVYIRDGEWIAALLPGSSDRQAYLASLELMKELDFDVLLPWTAGRGGPWHAMTDKADARRRIDAIMNRLRRGDDH